MTKNHETHSLIIQASYIVRYMVVQLIVWPWKLPALNLFDGLAGVSEPGVLKTEMLKQPLLLSSVFSRLL